MKATVYLRIAKGGKKGFKVEASTSPNHVPIFVKGSYNKPDEYLPTISFGTTFDLPDELFNQAETIVAEINVKMKDGVIASEIIVPKSVTTSDKKNKK